jgi:hypothetical protein
MPSLPALRSRFGSWLRKAHSPRVQPRAVLTGTRTEARGRLLANLVWSRVLRGWLAGMAAVVLGVLFVVAPPLAGGPSSGWDALAETLPTESSTASPGTTSPAEPSSSSVPSSSPDPSGSGSPSAEESSTPSPSATALPESGHVWTEDEAQALMVGLVLMCLFVPMTTVLLMRLR